MTEDTVTPNWKYIFQHISQNGAPDNIELKNNWFTLDLEEDPRKIRRHKVIFAPDNNNKTLMSLQSEQNLYEIPDSKGESAYELLECPVTV